jgi:hypothetical protein
MVEVPGRRELEEMQDGIENQSLEDIEVTDGKVNLKDMAKVLHALDRRNGQPAEGAAPSPTGDTDTVKSLRESVQVSLGLQRDLLESVVESAKALKELRPAPAPTPAPIVSDAEAIRAQTENDLLKHALSQGADNPLAMRVIEGILGKAPTNGSEDGPWWKEVLGIGFEKLGPTILTLGMAYLNSRAPGAAAMPQNGAPGAPGQTGQLPAGMPPQSQADPSEIMLGQIGQQIHAAIATGMSVYGVEDSVERLIAGFPDSRAAQIAQAIVTQDPKEVCRQLGITGPQGEKWIRDLQDDYRREQEDGDAQENPGEAGPEVMTFGASEG